MIKKKSCHKIPSVQKQPKPSIQCSVCNCFSTTTAFYVCDSGLIMCESCRKTSESEGRRDGGDYVLESACSKHAEIQKNQLLSPTKDLSSGDHDKKNKVPNKKIRVKSECKTNMGLDRAEFKGIALKHENGEKPELETIIEYKNANYRGDKSSTCSLIRSNSEHDVEYITELPHLPNNRVCPRWYHYLILQFSGPVKCPVGECNKMIALDSVMLHFYFDHSKVPRMTLNGCTARQLQFKPNNLISESHCLTILLLQEQNEVNTCTKVESSALIKGNCLGCKSLLLMAAKIQTDQRKIYNKKATTVEVCNVCTQTELLQNCVTKYYKKSDTVSAIKKSMPYESVTQDQFDRNETLLLWLCKQDDNTASYSISVLRKDKKQGLNYIGEAIHIRSEQSPAQIFQRAECLTVCGTALNRLLDENNQINVYIEVLA